MSASEPKWSRLDNAAKILPSTSSKKDPKVFRFSCELTEPVDGQTLQFALDQTMEKFPFYRSVLKRGLFWYYFEDSTRRPVVQPEGLPPCAPVYSADRKGLLFRVSFFERRINLEVYHAIADGTGALHFLRTLVYYYLLERRKEDFSGGAPFFDYDASQAQKRDDSFSRYYEKRPKASKGKAVKAYHQYGERWPDGRIAVLEGCMPVRSLLTLAHAHHATLTEYLTAQLLLSIRETMRLRETGRPVVITIPVNLRNYFPSGTARNFFGIINLGYDFSRQEDSIESVIAFIKEQFQKELTAEKLRERMNELSALEHNLLTQLVPLISKRPGAPPGQLSGGTGDYGCLFQRRKGRHASRNGTLYRQLSRFHLYQPAAGLYVFLWGALRYQLFFAICQHRYPAGLFPPPGGGRNCGGGHIQSGTVGFLIQKEVSA